MVLVPLELALLILMQDREVVMEESVHNLQLLVHLHTMLEVVVVVFNMLV